MGRRQINCGWANNSWFYGLSTYCVPSALSPLYIISFDFMHSRTLNRSLTKFFSPQTPTRGILCGCQY
jgi:hypothetical protein